MLVERCHDAGTKTQFDLTTCPSFDAQVTTDAPVTLDVSGGEISVLMRFSASAGTTRVVVSGLDPGHVYLKYEDTFGGGTALTASGAGEVVFQQDLTNPHSVVLQTRHASTPLTPATCIAPVAAWNATTATCTLLAPAGSISIDADGMTLDCGGHQVGDATNRIGVGVLASRRAHVSIQNCSILNADFGISAFRSSDITVSRVQIGSAGSPAAAGIGVAWGSATRLREVAIQNAYIGIQASQGEGLQARSVQAIAPAQGTIATLTLEANAVVEGVVAEGGEAGIIVGASPNVAIMGVELRRVDGQAIAVVGNTTGVIRAVMVSQAGIGMRLDSPSVVELSDSTIEGQIGLVLSGAQVVFHNNIAASGQRVFGFNAMEVSDPRPTSATYRQGNYWGHDCTTHLFSPGMDSNSPDVVDSYPYGAPNGWLFKMAPGCTAPPAPEILVPAEGQRVNTSRLLVAGKSAPHAGLEILAGAQSLGTTTADLAGGFALQSGLPLPNGRYTLTAIATVAGQRSPPSRGVDVVIDTAVPAAPTFSFPQSGAVVSAQTPLVIIGNAEPNSAVSLEDRGVFLGRTTTTQRGIFLFAPPRGLAVGVHSLVASSRDEAGNASPPSSPLAFKVAQISPTTPLVGPNAVLTVNKLSDRPEFLVLGSGTPNVQTAEVRVRHTPTTGGNGQTKTVVLRREIRDSFHNVLVAQAVSEIRLPKITGVGSQDGTVSVEWNGTDFTGKNVAPGLYPTLTYIVVVADKPGNGTPHCIAAPVTPGMSGRCVIDEVVLVGGNLPVDTKPFDLLPTTCTSDADCHANEICNLTTTWVTIPGPDINTPDISVPIRAPGYRTCECVEGFSFAYGRCRFNNRCLLANGGCHRFATCTPDLSGTPQCACDAGFSGDGKYCLDVDECAGQGACPTSSTCQNQVGTFDCRCDSASIFVGGKCAPCPEPVAPGDTCRREHDAPTDRVGHEIEVRAGASGVIPPDAYANALEQRRLMEGPVPFSTAFERNWSLVAPHPVVEGDFAYNGPLPSAGRVTAIAVDPSDRTGDTVYIGTMGGGPWKTQDGGKTWSPLATDSQPSLPVGALALKPRNPAHVFVGLGEQNGGTSYTGLGILKSTDSGVTWDLVQDPPGTTPDKMVISQTHIGRIAFDAKAPWRIYAATDRGLAISYDDGETWALESIGLPFPANAKKRVTDVAVDPVTDTVYAAVTELASGLYQTRVYSSGTTQLSWSLCAAFPVSVARVRLALATAPVVGGASPFPMLYAIAERAGNVWVFASERRCSDWQDRSPEGGFDPEDACGVSGDRPGGQCGYNLDIGVAPGNPNTVLAATVRLYKTSNGGGHWIDLSLDGEKLHVDQHAVAFLPGRSDAFYVGNDGGVYRTTNWGASFTPLNENLPITEFARGAVAHGNLLAGAQDNGVLALPLNAPGWTRVRGGDGGFSAIDFEDPTTAYSTTQNLGVVYSCDGLTGSFTERTSGIDSSEEREFVAPLIMDPSDATCIYAGTTRLYRHRESRSPYCAPFDPGAVAPFDLAAFWTKLGMPTAIGRLTAIAVGPHATVDEHCAQTVYAATTSKLASELWRSDDHGLTFQKIGIGLPGRRINAIHVQSDRPEVIWVALAAFGVGHVWESTDRGDHFGPISGDACAPDRTPPGTCASLPDAPVYAIASDPDSPSVLYVGGEVGVFRRAGTSGTSWVSFNTGMPITPVRDLASERGSGVVPGGHRLYAFTAGRSAFEVTLPRIAHVFGWGGNADGELGVGTTFTHSPFALAIPHLGAVSVAAGAHHSFALRPDGSLWAWGANGHGQLGTDSTFPRTSPTRVAGLPTVIGVATGSEANHSLAVTEDGTVWGWGDLSFGKLADLTPDYLCPNCRATPAPIISSPIPIPPMDAVAVGASHSLALATDGTVWAWGDNSLGQAGGAGSPTHHARPVQVPRPLPGVGPLSGIVAIAAGGTHSLAVDRFGYAYAWGDNSSGQLGAPTSETCDGVPCSRTPVLAGVTVFPPPAFVGYESVAAGAAHSLALTKLGEVVSWGDNSAGQLGDGTLVGGSTPVCVGGSGESSLPPGASCGAARLLKGVKTLAAGGRHSIALLHDGSVRVWGTSPSLPSLVPTPKPLSDGHWRLQAIGGIAAGDAHGIAYVGASVRASQTVVAAGEQLTISWNDVSDPAPDDTVGLYSIDRPLDPPACKIPTGGTSDGACCPPGGPVSCSVRLTAAPGAYQLRLSSVGGVGGVFVRAKSEPIEVVSPCASCPGECKCDLASKQCISPVCGLNYAGETKIWCDRIKTCVDPCPGCAVFTLSPDGLSVACEPLCSNSITCSSGQCCREVDLDLVQCSVPLLPPDPCAVVPAAERCK
ncbi:MAG: hypothetical protein HY901_24500 [Deltaproteobacteria bacterium]|nr:hypothetical protein [Deltaproteobacteria bacterium]